MHTAVVKKIGSIEIRRPLRSDARGFAALRVFWIVRIFFLSAASKEVTVCGVDGRRTCFALAAALQLFVGTYFHRLGDFMATPTAVPAQEEVKKAPLNLTPQAIAKVREIMATQDPLPSGLRIGVVGGGCSGFQYSMAFENQPGMMDKVFSFDDLKVYVDATSLMYLNGCTVDYVETLEAAGFKFDNPQVKSTCGCGSSFSV
jgi:iron-sulfur cluster assembly accessory protein